MRTRVLTIRMVSAVLTLCSASAFACENYPLTDAQRKYIEELSLPLAIPQGKFAEYVPNKSHERPPTKTEPECWVSQDFDGDGIDDFAGIFEYTGEKIRSSGWQLDLVILYSDAGQLRHFIFPFAGRITEEGGELRQHLGLQAAGRVDLEPGDLIIDHPAIVSYRDSQPAVIYFWNDRQFSKRTYFIDD